MKYLSKYNLILRQQGWVVLILVASFNSFSQSRNSIWCFGDSAGVDFSNITNPQTFISAANSRGSCASIADSAGALLFYAFTRATWPGYTGIVYNKQHQVMNNGDLILGQGWYSEMLILPSPANSNQYYLFSIGVTNGTDHGLFYSIIDLTQNGGLGSVIQKNIQLDTTNAVDCLKAVKHGNGRDWWIFYRKWDTSLQVSNKRFYKYLLTPNGVSLFGSQAIGSQINTGFGNISFIQDGTKMAYVNYRGVINIMNFNRCTGQLSQVRIIQEEAQSVTSTDSMYYISCEFSPSSDYLYVSRNNTASQLFQYDLNSPDPAADRDTIHVFSDSPYAAGYLRRAPDNKIYLSNAWYNGWQWNFPYQDSVYNYINMNLSVINEPDQPGQACDFQPYSFNLGGRRTYWGLPNNPDYDLAALTGSACDTLVGIPEMGQNIQGELLVYYSSSFETLFINARNLEGKIGLFQIYDESGKMVLNQTEKILQGLITKDISFAKFAKGTYMVLLQTANDKLVKRFVKD